MFSNCLANDSELCATKPRVSLPDESEKSPIHTPNDDTTLLVGSTPLYRNKNVPFAAREFWNFSWKTKQKRKINDIRTSPTNGNLITLTNDIFQYDFDIGKRFLQLVSRSTEAFRRLFVRSKFENEKKAPEKSRSLLLFQQIYSRQTKLAQTTHTRQQT